MTNEQASVLVAHAGAEKISREQLALVPCPEGTDTHRPIPHHELINSLEETLGFRHISIVRCEFAITADGNKMFGLLEIDQTFDGARFALGVRNSHDKTMRLAMTIGYRVFVCDNMAFHGDFTPVLAKHTKNFVLTRALSVGVDEMQRNFDPMVNTAKKWQQSLLADATAKLIIYRAFIENEAELPRHLAGSVHDFYFNPKDEAFQPRTMWSLSNAFTSAFKELEPVPQFKATGKLATFLEHV
jgi:hypothetical protein